MTCAIKRNITVYDDCGFDIGNESYLRCFLFIIIP